MMTSLNSTLLAPEHERQTELATADRASEREGWLRQAFSPRIVAWMIGNRASLS